MDVAPSTETAAAPAPAPPIDYADETRVGVGVGLAVLGVLGVVLLAARAHRQAAEKEPAADG